MNTWGTTSEWAGSGPHKFTHMGSPGMSPCCQSNLDAGLLSRMQGRDGDMSMIDRDNGDVLEVWQCNECFRVWFGRPGMAGLFMVQPVQKDDFR